MKSEKENNRERLEYLTSLYEAARAAISDKHAELARSMRQYKGDDEIDGSSERALTVRNITYEIIESEISPDIPVAKVDTATFSETRERNARTVERLCQAVRERLPFEELCDIDERYTYIYGASVWYIEWDNSGKLDTGTGSVRISCLSPLNFIPQPGITAVDDMDYCFLKFTTTKSELMRRYGVSGEDVGLAECEYEYGGGGESDTVALIIAFWKDGKGRIGRSILSGSLLIEDIADYYGRKMSVCRGCGRAAEDCECDDPRIEAVDLEYESVTLPEGNVNIPFYSPHSFPIVVRKNTSEEGSVLGQSDCAFIRPEQQAINKLESRILQKLLRSGVTPVMPEDASVSLNNSVFGQLIRMKPGESLSQYGTVDTTPSVESDIAEADRLYQHAKNIIGISSAFQGLDDTAESGYARELKISQSNARLESKRRMKYHAYAGVYRKIFEHYLAFADEPRRLSYKDAYGRLHLAEFNRYDFIERSADGEYEYSDAYLFSVDLNSGGEYAREMIWEKNLENLRLGTLGDKDEPTTLLRYWQSQERAHYPYARENVEYFTSIVEERKESKHD